jgi:hypothetical protein
MDYGTLQMLKFEVHAVKESAIDVRSLARIIILLAKDLPCTAVTEENQCGASIKLLHMLRR